MKCFISTFRFNLTTNKKIIEKNILIKHRKEKKDLKFIFKNWTKYNSREEKTQHSCEAEQKRRRRRRRIGRESSHDVTEREQAVKTPSVQEQSFGRGRVAQKARRKYDHTA